MNETKTKNIRAVKSGAGLVITLPVEFCRKAGIYLPPGAGYHWIRRRVATVVRKACGGSDIDAHRFMRWSEPRELSMLALYDEARYEETDEAILAKHPFVKMWEEATPYVFKFNPAYQSLFDMLT